MNPNATAYLLISVAYTFASYCTLANTFGFSKTLFTGDGKSFGRKQVAFYVTGIGGNSTHQGYYLNANGVPVTYLNTMVNIGGAFDAKRGIFTSPVDGLYYFSWFGCKYESSKDKYFLIRIVHDGYPDDQVQIATPSYSNTEFRSDGSKLTLGASTHMFLKMGDTVQAFVYGDLLYTNEAPGNFINHPQYIGFLGYLVHTVV